MRAGSCDKGGTTDGKHGPHRSVPTVSHVASMLVFLLIGQKVTCALADRVTLWETREDLPRVWTSFRGLAGLDECERGRQSTFLIKKLLSMFPPMIDMIQNGL